MRNLDKHKMSRRPREQVLQAAGSGVPSVQSSFRSPLNAAKHPGFPILIQGARATVHDAETEAWRGDPEALGGFQYTTPRGTAPETGYLREATELFDRVLRHRERAIPRQP